MRTSSFTIVSVVTALSLISFGCMDSTNPISAQEVVSNNSLSTSVNSGPSLFMDQSRSKIFYAVGSRFLATVKKADLHKATSILDFVPKTETEGLKSYENVKVTVLKKDGETVEMGNEATLNEAQLKLLRSTDYSTNFYINADANKGTYELGEQSTYDLVYYFTVVPENEATYQDGNEALVDFIEENTKKLKSSIIADQLKAGKVGFTITKTGSVSSVYLDSSSGFESLDKAVINLLGSSPSNWNPASNEAGENVEQELVFSFGTMGC